MEERYFVIDEFGDKVGSAWYCECGVYRYFVGVVSLGREYGFRTFREMMMFLWEKGLDAVLERGE